MIVVGGIYRHYKSTGGDDHTYRVVGLGKHSETEELMVVYEPLYDACDTRLGDVQYVVRPLSMREEEVEWDGDRLNRFTLIGSPSGEKR